MKILYYYPEYNTPMFAWQRVHIFNELEHHGVEIDSFNPLLCESFDESNDRLLGMAKSKKYDLFMTCICSEKMLYICTLLEIKKLGIPTLSFRPDNLMIPFNDKKLAPLFDLLWLTSKETQHLYDRWQVNTVFLPYAANPFSFQFKERKIERKVIFIGTPYGSRTRMMNALTAHGVYLDLYYGGGKPNNFNLLGFTTKINVIQQTPYQIMWDRLFYKEGRKDLIGRFLNVFKGNIQLLENEFISHFSSLDPSELSDYYAKYTLSLASTSANHTDVLSSPLKIINLRNFEIPMSGGIEICRYNTELAEYFEENKEIIFYHTNEELVDKAKYYTQSASDKQILDIKRAARLRAANNHSWWNRFTVIFDTLGLKY